jgi:SAM-dependent methyltransferase
MTTEQSEPHLQRAIPERDPLETSLAPRQSDLLNLPFDQYGRMVIVQNALLALYAELAGAQPEPPAKPAALSVLDVGGYPGILRHFLSPEAYRVSVLDVVPDTGEIPGYTQGSGMELPFEDASFDVVTSLDTLEHVPQPLRARFLAEVMRVARHGIVIINPVQSLDNDLAEELVDEYVRWVLDAQQEQLAEHRGYGLPDFAATCEALDDAGWKTTRFPVANVHNWLFMMVAKHYLLSLRDERASAFEKTLDRFYNLTFSAGDRAEPAYRGAIVAVRPGAEGALREIERLYPPVPADAAANNQRLQLGQLLMSLIDLKTANHEDRKLRDQMERRDRHISGMEGRIALLEEQKRDLEAKLDDLQRTHGEEFEKHAHYIARLEEEQRSKDEHILYLEKLLQGIESGRVLRLTRAFARFLGRS